MISALLVMGSLAGCAGDPVPREIDAEADERVRHGDEIVIAGEYMRTGTPVVLWSDQDGYDAYSLERHFVRDEEAVEPHHLDGRLRYGERPRKPEACSAWTIEQLESVVDQVVLHYDVSGTSRNCFRVLHDVRGLSAHFLLDVDGTIYQTLDVQERAWHATKANDRSIGIEIAHIGAYPPGESGPLDEWYRRTESGEVVLVVPERFDGGGVRDPGAGLSPARPDLIHGIINGRELVMFDFTRAQYESLSKLLGALHTALPSIPLQMPVGPDGSVVPHVLKDDEFDAFSGILGHYHVQEGKIDPGPAFQWEALLEEARDVKKF